MNRVFLIGNLGRDPELRNTPTGKAVASFSLATKDRDKTEWHNIIAWEKTGELCAQYLRKGSKCCVEGSIQSRKYTTKDGVEKTAYEIVAQRVEFLDSRGDGGGERPQGRATAPAARPDDNDVPF